MSQLIPENVTRRLDSLGRVTLPKGLRDRMFLTSDRDELEIFTAVVDNKNCICLARKVSDDEKLNEAIDLVKANGYVLLKKE